MTRTLFLLAIALLLTGCKVGPNYHAPKHEMPVSWLPPTTAPTTQNASTPTTRPIDVAAWWGTFNDAALDSLITRAVESNLDLKQAESRVRQARAQRGIVVAGLLPQANVGAGYAREGSDGPQISTGPGGTVEASRGSRDLWVGGFDATWELDVFGGVQRQVEAADANILFAVEDRRDVLVTLTSEIALNYIDLRGLQRQLAIARENLKAQLYTADLTRRRQRGGLVSALDVAQADAQVASTRSQIPFLEQSARQTIYNIALLLGREPSALVAELDPPTAIPPTPGTVPIGLPSELLRRRPDIRRAEAQLHAATANVGVATSDLFPKFNLTGSINVNGDQFQNLFNWNNAFWSIGPNVSWPIFSAGSIRANIRVQNELQAQAALTYEQAVLTALRDVESALVAYAQEQHRLAALRDAVSSNHKAVDIAQRLYSQGQTDFLNVLTAERSLFNSEDALAQSQRTMSTNLVALYKALGGGWEAIDVPATQPVNATAE